MNHHETINHSSTHSLAVAATLHCITGCAIGEILGLMIGTAIGLSTIATITLAVALAFFFGYLLSIVPLIKSGMSLSVAAKAVLVGDTFSIAAMEFADNATMIAIPGAMESGLAHPLFWASMTFALFIGFWAAYPVNRYRISKNNGQAMEHCH